MLLLMLVLPRVQSCKVLTCLRLVQHTLLTASASDCCNCSDASLSFVQDAVSLWDGVHQRAE